LFLRASLTKDDSSKTRQPSKPNGAEVAKLEVLRETPKSLTQGSAPRPPSTEQVPRTSTETPIDLSATPSNHLSTETPKPINIADSKGVSHEAEEMRGRFVSGFEANANGNRHSISHLQQGKKSFF
jgi:hypothetical protein